MNSNDKMVISISVIVLVLLCFALTFVLQNDKTFKQRFDMDKPSIFSDPTEVLK